MDGFKMNSRGRLVREMKGGFVAVISERVNQGGVKTYALVLIDLCNESSLLVAVSEDLKEFKNIIGVLEFLDLFEDE